MDNSNAGPSGSTSKPVGMLESPPPKYIVQGAKEDRVFFTVDLFPDHMQIRGPGTHTTYRLYVVYQRHIVSQTEEKSPLLLKSLARYWVQSVSLSFLAGLASEVVRDWISQELHPGS
uniref:Uncharacterized protein n=1 Tax=Romanomermis culicivorax TaxID=13658 RepID=A0A915KLS4_ROMCU